MHFTASFPLTSVPKVPIFVAFTVAPLGNSAASGAVPFKSDKYRVS